jgi:hypothetical protein
MGKCSLLCVIQRRPLTSMSLVHVWVSFGQELCSGGHPAGPAAVSDWWPSSQVSYSQMQSRLRGGDVACTADVGAVGHFVPG